MEKEKEKLEKIVIEKLERLDRIKEREIDLGKLEMKIEIEEEKLEKEKLKKSEIETERETEKLEKIVIEKIEKLGRIKEIGIELEKLEIEIEIERIAIEKDREKLIENLMNWLAI